jgi:hypothetical protein
LPVSSATSRIDVSSGARFFALFGKMLNPVDASNTASA